MNKIRSLLKPRIELNMWQSFLFIALASFFLTLFMLWLQPDGIHDVIKCISESKGLSLLLNWLPVAVLMLIMFFMGLNAIGCAALAGFLFSVAGFVNRLKILLRNDPFFPWDLSLGGELAGIAKSFGIKLILAIIFALILYLVVSICLSMIIRSRKFDLRLHIAGAVLCVLAALLLNKPLYKNTALNNRLYVIGNIYNQVNTFNSKGFLYSFIYTWNTNKISKPEGYDIKTVKDKISSFDMLTPESYSNLKKPHIIMVMGEAFSEMSMLDSFDFTGFTDPLENYKRIKQESIYGQIVVPNLGGGTADTEFDVLTGISTRHFRGAPFAFRLIGGEFESVATSLNTIGYRSEFMHPGHAWFYNRQNVYKYMGFERLVFMDEFDGIETKGMYINEADTIERLIEMFEESLASHPDSPYYNFTVTIQNHGPYKDKYLVDTNFETDAEISTDDINAISNYYEGLIDADLGLARLVEYFDSIQEPVVLIYFGDHLPAFTARVYDAYYPSDYKDGSLQDLTRLYKMPFIIWANSEAKGMSQPLNDAFTDYFGEGNNSLLFSSNYLGAYIMELLGFNGISPYMDYVNEVRRDFPVITEYRSFDKDANPSTETEGEKRQKLLIYRDWEAFKIFDNK